MFFPLSGDLWDTPGSWCSSYLTAHISCLPSYTPGAQSSDNTSSLTDHPVTELELASLPAGLLSYSLQPGPAHELQVPVSLASASLLWASEKHLIPLASRTRLLLFPPANPTTPHSSDQIPSLDLDSLLSLSHTPTQSIRLSHHPCLQNITESNQFSPYPPHHTRPAHHHPR